MALAGADPPLIVICGCLAIFSIGLSALSAHFELPPTHWALLDVSGGRHGFYGRRRRQKGPAHNDHSTGQAEIAASYSRFSSDMQRDESNTDQQRKCREAAERNGHRILSELEYSDEAISGTKLRRKGLDAMLRDAEAGEFQVLYLHSLSRLARESVITMPMLKRLVYTFRVRIISVTEVVDSARDNWEMIASIMSLLHECYIKELAENVLRGQEGTVLSGFSVGDLRFGYTSTPIPGSETTRRGRNSKPRMAYKIDEVTAPWVLRIFHWFVIERRSLRWITRELNRLGAPKDHRATTKDWHHQQVASLLASEKYVGIWPWGEMKNTRDPETGKVRQEPRPDEECEKWTREFPHLRIVDDETFEKAQQLLQANFDTYARNRSSNGKRQWGRRGSADNPPRHLLSGLIKCGECGSPFYVGAANGKYLYCPNYHKGICKCQTTLRRDRAERMILDEIGKRILEDPAWLRAVYEQTVKSCNHQEQQAPSKLAVAERALVDLDQKIKRLVDQIENGLDDPNVKQRLTERRTERRDWVKTIEGLRRASNEGGPPPTEEWVRGQLGQLGEILNGGKPAAACALGDLLGGKIVVKEIRCEGRQRFHLQGHITISANRVASAITGDHSEEVHDTQNPAQCLRDEMIIDFVEPNPLDGPSEGAKKLYDQGLMCLTIAERLGCSRSQVTKLIKHWFESRGLPMPDGRARRGDLETKHMEAPLYQKASDEVKRLCDEGLLLGEISKRLDMDRNTVTKSHSHWYEKRGLPIPDGRTRRKSLECKSSQSRLTNDDDQGSARPG